MQNARLKWLGFRHTQGGIDGDWHPPLQTARASARHRGPWHGIGLVVQSPPRYTAVSHISLSSQLRAPKTAAIIAGSIPVLRGALARLAFPVSLTDLQSRVEARLVSPRVLELSATARTRARALAIDRALERSLLAYYSAAYLETKRAADLHALALLDRPKVQR
jgi:hypothetical protein